MTDRFPALRSPIRLGPASLRNRIVLLPHGLFFASWDRLIPTDRHVEYYRARAVGGVAMVCVESTVVSRDGQQSAPLVLSSDPRCVEGYARIADAVHAEGAVVSGQLTHYGNQACQAVTCAPLLGPSTLGDPALREPARPMDADDRERITADFVAGARNLVAAGFDVVDLKVAHDGLLRQYLSPLCNDRQDEYGGSIANRMRYPLEVAAAVRAAVGPDVALSVRLVLDERLPGGYDLADGVAFAAGFGSSGLVDFVMADLGIWASMPMVVAPMSVPEGYATPSVAAAAKACGVPVVGFGRIHTPEVAERLVAEGTVEAVGMARELIAEPDFARKVLGGRPETVRPCTACNQLCVGNAMKGLPVSCTVNPRVGHGEARTASARAPMRVVVVGGGPAGMEASRLLADVGHQVTLFERRARLGGQLLVAAETGGRTGWQPYLDWLDRELTEVGVDVRAGTVADVGSVDACGPDLVVLACGSDAPTAMVPGAVTLDDYLCGGGHGGRVVFADMGAAGPALWSAALHAALRGAAAVTVVTPLPAAVADLDAATYVDLYGELVRQDVTMMTDHQAQALADGTVQAVHVYSGVVASLHADTVVVVAQRRTAGHALEAALRARAGGTRVIRIGDAVVPRDAAAAVRDAYDLVDARQRAEGRTSALRDPLHFVGS